MTRASVGKKIGARSEYWRERIAEQERSGMSVQRFCKEQGLTEQSFYLWRKRLLEQQPMRFALVETGSARRQPATEQVWKWCWRPASGCALAPASTARRCVRCWKLCAHDPPAGQCAVISVPDCVRHAQEL